MAKRASKKSKKVAKAPRRNPRKKIDAFNALRKALGVGGQFQVTWKSGFASMVDGLEILKTLPDAFSKMARVTAYPSGKQLYKAAAVLLLLLFSVLPVRAQIGNVLYVKTSTPGTTVGAKVTTAAARCNSSSSYTCVLVIVPELGLWAEGTMPTLASHITVVDLRLAGDIDVGTIGKVLTVGGSKYPTIQSAIDVTGAGNAVVVVPPRAAAYLQIAPVSIIDKSNLLLAILEGAKVRADPSFTTAGFPLVDITGSGAVCDNIAVTGKGVIDSNFVAGEAVQIGGDCTGNYYIEGIEVKNALTTGTNPLIAVNVAAKVHVANIHGHTATNQAVIRAQGGSSLWVTESILTDAKHGVSCVSTAYCLVRENEVADTTDTGIYSFASDYVDWYGNGLARVSTAAGQAVHADTVAGGCVGDNRITESPVGGSVFIEVSSNTCAENNRLDTSGSVMIGNPANGARQLVFSNNVLDVTTDLVANTDVVLAVDAADKQEGAASVEATIAAGFTTGFVFYDSTIGTALNFENPWHDIWIKSDTTVNDGVLQICLSPSADFSSRTLCVDLPHIPAATWIHVSELAKLWNLNYENNQPLTWGIYATADPGAVILNFDDYETGLKLIGLRAAGNVVVNSAGPCLQFGILTGGVIENNKCKDPFWGSGGADRIAYKAVNSTGVSFKDNSATFTTKSAGNPGVYLDVDATSVIEEGGSQSTGHDTLFQIAGGGIVRQTVNAGLAADGGGVKHGRFASGTTAATLHATASGTWTFTTAFVDTNYTVACTIDDPTGVPVVANTSAKLAASVDVSIMATTAAAASGTLNCVAVHD